MKWLKQHWAYVSSAVVVPVFGLLIVILFIQKEGALAISVASVGLVLFLGLWTFEFQRRDLIMRSRPFLGIAGREWRDEKQGDITFKIGNYGFGPAIVNSNEFRITKNGQVVDNGGGEATWSVGPNQEYTYFLRKVTGDCSVWFKLSYADLGDIRYEYEFDGSFDQYGLQVNLDVNRMLD